jgi:glucosyl-3-phosphoglycerate synthase
MQASQERWFAERTWQRPTWTAAELLECKRGRSVSVVLPALNEERTVRAIVAAVHPFTRGPRPLVDELVVLDSGSCDATRAEAEAGGARVVDREQALPSVEPRPGKGEALWRSLAVTSGDLVVFLDSDLVEFDAKFVVSLLGPLLTEDGVALVKGFYRRPLRLEHEEPGHGGGRVTELLARPVLSAVRPELAGIIQPLGGEYAATREFLESVPFAPGYGVEIGLLLDVHARRGLSAIAQVNLGVRKHRNRDLQSLGLMASQILATALGRCERTGLTASTLTQFFLADEEWVPLTHQVDTRDRPPMGELVRRTGAGADRTRSSAR